MSRLFSSVSAITSRTDRYRFPPRTSDSRRGVLVRLAGEKTRRSKWKGRSSGPTTGASLGSEIVTSDDCWPNAAKPSISNEKTRRMQFICLGKLLLNITNRVQFLFQSIIVATVQTFQAVVSGFATHCPYGGLTACKPWCALLHEMRDAFFEILGAQALQNFFFRARR